MKKSVSHKMLTRAASAALAAVLFFGAMPVQNALAADPLSTGQTAPSGPITIVMIAGNPFMTLNGKEVFVDADGVRPIVAGGRTLVPVRSVVSNMGGEVGWDAIEKKVTLKLGGKTVDLWIGKTEAVADSVTMTLDAAPSIIGGKTMIPVRFVSENLGLNVEWLSEKRAVVISNAKIDPATLIFPASTVWRKSADGAEVCTDYSALSGTYTGAGSGNLRGQMITVTYTGNGEFTFDGGAWWAADQAALNRGAINVGEAAGKALITFATTSAQYKDSKGTLTFRFYSGGKLVIEETGKFGGQNVTFANTYQKNK